MRVCSSPFFRLLQLFTMLFTQLAVTLAVVSTSLAKPLVERAYSVDLQTAAHGVYASWISLEGPVNSFQPNVKAVESVRDSLNKVTDSFNILDPILITNGALEGDEANRLMWDFKDAGPHSALALTGLAGKRNQIETLGHPLVSEISQSLNTLGVAYTTFEERLLTSGVSQAKIDEFESGYQVKTSLEAAKRAFL
ncbi:hypothetical protein CPB83DRAFT_865144, partial [Crepidotus variabilis]